MAQVPLSPDPRTASGQQAAPATIPPSPGRRYTPTRRTSRKFSQGHRTAITAAWTFWPTYSSCPPRLDRTRPGRARPPLGPRSRPHCGSPRTHRPPRTACQLAARKRPARTVAVTGHARIVHAGRSDRRKHRGRSALHDRWPRPHTYTRALTRGAGDRLCDHHRHAPHSNRSQISEYVRPSARHRRLTQLRKQNSKTMPHLDL